ncbi:uncharacterized protein LOC133286875 [Gastrolobium bilobum]|uniref:uncharacterized protein LOC133286875 n=1 Tax=Gastrolobium bilobum TaxID=150636 RepID=UPI002AAF20F5|nr:uncharacterized protein LOC133286875 [Gastrolobium bilobum]
MASTSNSSDRSSSPPPSTSSPPVSLLRHPLSPPRTYTFEQRSRKRRRVEEKRDTSLIHGFDLQLHANEILQSEDLSKLQTAIEEFSKSSTKKKNLESKRLFDSLALHYPNAFSFKLAKLLNLQPPLDIRTVAVDLLHQTLTKTHGHGDLWKINKAMLMELKNPLLQSVKIESEESLLPPLCKTIGNVASRVYEYPLGGWKELLEYVCSCVSGDSNLNHRKGLMLLAELPFDASGNREFWENGNYGTLTARVSMLVNSTDEEFQGLKFDASFALMGMSINLGRTEVCDSLLPITLEFIDRHVEEKTVVDRLRRLADLVCLDEGEIFKGKEGDVFQGMLRLAEAEGASEELRCAAVLVLKELDEENMDAMENVMKNLPLVEVKRVLALCMEMLTCVQDDPLWYELDNVNCEEAGMLSESFRRGKFLLNWLCSEGDESIFIPTVIEMVRETYIADKDWRKRHAGIMAIGRIAQGQSKDMIQVFEQVKRLVFTSLNDTHPRVVWFAIHATNSLSEYKELVPNVQYHMKFLAKLVFIIKSSLFPRVQAYAIIAIRFLVTYCGLDRMASFGEEIVTIMLLLLKHEKQKLQEEAAETLTLIAVSIPLANFRKYYDTTMDSLKDILFHNYSSPKLLLRAKCLACMSSIVLRVEQVKFDEQEAVLNIALPHDPDTHHSEFELNLSIDSYESLSNTYEIISYHANLSCNAVKVIDSLISLDGKLRSTDHALDQFFRCPGVDVDRFINKVMPMLLRSAQLDIDLKDDSLDCGGKNFDVETERLWACNVLSNCAVRWSSLVFSPHISKVSKIFVRWLGCSSFETQKASILALPNLLRSVQSVVQNEVSQKSLTAFIVESLVEALSKEADEDLFMTMLRSLPECIQISNSVFTTQLIKMTASVIKQILNKIIKIEKEQEAGTSEGGSEYLPDEKIILSANHLITTTIETFEARLLPYVDDFISTVALLWGDDFRDRVKAFAISIFNIIVQQFPEKLQMYHDQYTLVLLKAFRDENSHAQLEAARGIGFCAMFGGHKFKPIANVAISSLYSGIKRFSIRGGSGYSSGIYDTAVSAFGKICEFHRENIEATELLFYIL